MIAAIGIYFKTGDIRLGEYYQPDWYIWPTQRKNGIIFTQALFLCKVKYWYLKLTLVLVFPAVTP